MFIMIGKDFVIQNKQMVAWAMLSWLWYHSSLEIIIVWWGGVIKEIGEINYWKSSHSFSQRLLM